MCKCVLDVCLTKNFQDADTSMLGRELWFGFLGTILWSECVIVSVQKQIMRSECTLEMFSGDEKVRGVLQIDSLVHLKPIESNEE